MIPISETSYMTEGMAMNNDRMAVDTGGAQGLGWAISQRLARDGFEVVLLDRQSSAEDRALELTRAGHRASAVLVDLMDEASIRSAALDVLKRFERCDVLVNNAGVHFKNQGKRMTFEAVSSEDWARTVAVNLTAPLLQGQAFIAGMKERRWGRVINMSSRAGRTYASPASPSYAATKAGIVGLTIDGRRIRSLRNHLQLRRTRKDQDADDRCRLGCRARCRLARNPRRSRG